MRLFYFILCLHLLLFSACHSENDKASKFDNEGTYSKIITEGLYEKTDDGYFIPAYLNDSIFRIDWKIAGAGADVEVK